MPAPGRPSETHKQIISKLLTDDPDLQAMARAYVKAGFAELLNQLHRGDAQTRAAIARSLAATVTKAITETDEDDQHGDLRAEMHKMMGELRGELMPEDEPLEPPRVMVPKS